MDHRRFSTITLHPLGFRPTYALSVTHLPSNHNFRWRFAYAAGSDKLFQSLAVTVIRGAADFDRRLPKVAPEVDVLSHFNAIVTELEPAALAALTIGVIFQV